MVQLTKLKKVAGTMIHADTLIHNFRNFARGYVWILEIFTKLNQLSRENTYIRAGGIAYQRE